MLLMEVYARSRLSGLRDASVIVHCPIGWTTVYDLLQSNSHYWLHRLTYLVVLPIVWIGGVIHPYSEVLGTRKEEITIIRKLTGVAARVIMNDSVGNRFRNQILPYEP